jgi:hypothetical protein
MIKKKAKRRSCKSRPHTLSVFAVLVSMSEQAGARMASYNREEGLGLISRVCARKTSLDL